ncbi:MAG: anthranilate synthase component I family protein [Pyrinomonadaceae bacterium]
MNTAKKLLKTLQSSDELVASLLALSETENICLLDSCGVDYSGSNFLIAGINPIEFFEITNENPSETLLFLDDKLSSEDLFSIFTISYQFGLKLEKINPREKNHQGFNEPDIFLAIFDCLVVHDYQMRKTFLVGNEKRFDEIEAKLESSQNHKQFNHSPTDKTVPVTSNFSKPKYLAAIEKIKEHIRRGDTYQTNLTQQIRARLPEDLTAQKIFWNLRKNNPAPFAAFLQRKDSTVISASPERFFRVESGEWRAESEKKSSYQCSTLNSPLSTLHSPLISASPIKGTRPRGTNFEEDLILQNELLGSEKDRAENVMIVDLLRNDLGRICEFGSVEVEKLCDLETHPTLFHLVSTINGNLRANIKFSDIIRAAFPCGSITGAPKIRTMQIIDELETAPRGLSMGTIGYSIPDSRFQIPDSKSDIHHSPSTIHHYYDLSVAIRTMVIHGQTAVFNVGGGIVIDSDPETEYEETLLKAKALLKAFGGKL